MNVRVASPEQIFQLLKQNDDKMRVAQRLAGQLVQRRDTTDKMIEDHMTMLLSYQLHKMSLPYGMATTTIPPQYAPSYRDLGSFNKITVKEMQLETHHRGKVLVGKLIVDPIRFLGISSLIKDEAGTVEKIQIYHQDSRLDANAVLSKNSIIAIKEPYFKATADGSHGVRVDHLSDVIFLSKNDSLVPIRFRSNLDLVPDAGILKSKGNDAVASKDWVQAEKWYSEGLRLSPNRDLCKALHLNRALIRIHLGWFDAAVDDANHALSFESTNFKALYRKALALYKLGKFHGAGDVLEILCNEYSDDQQAKHLTEKNKSRLVEHQSGIYNFAALSKSVSLRSPWLDIATFCIPLTVKQTAKNGRGLFARKAVRIGELLMVEKAFQVSYKEKRDDTQMLLDFNTRRGFLGTHAVLLNHLIQKCFRNPSQHAALLDLFSGDYPSSPEEGTILDDVQITDTFHIARIMQFNAFGCPLLSSEQFEKPVRTTPQATHAGIEQNELESSGIWLTASLVNHACKPNAYRSFIGDAMILRATREINEGEEITIDYVNAAMLSVKERKEKMKSWGFECQCELCKAEVQITEKLLKKRAVLVEDLKRVFGAANLRRVDNAAFVEDSLRVIKKLEDTYPRTILGKLPRTTLTDPYLALSHATMDSGNFSAAAALATSALEALGFAISNVGEKIHVDRTHAILQDYSVDAFVQLALAEHNMTHTVAAQRFWEEAALCYQIIVGEQDTFRAKYKEEWKMIA